MSLRNFLKKYLPHRDHVQKRGGIHLLSGYLHDPNIWHVQRRSAAGGAAVGMFCSFIPLPIHTLSSAILAIYFRVNLPIAVVFSFFSNPVTIPPLFYFCYRLGATILGEKHHPLEFTFTWEWINSVFVQIWEPLLLGCFITASISSLLTYISVRLIWRYTAINKWLNRRKIEKVRKELKDSQP